LSYRPTIGGTLAPLKDIPWPKNREKRSPAADKTSGVEIMGQIVTSSLGSTGANESRPGQNNVSAEQAAFNRSVAGAAGVVNASGILGQNREVTFAVDPASRRPVVRVLDTDTKEVIEQWPSEYLLQMAAQANLSTEDSR
jgi:uncharacterized FlaG/YvyC family protein